MNKVQKILLILLKFLLKKSDIFMAAPNITSLFPNNRFDETITICLNESFANKQFVSSFDRDSFEKLQRFIVKSHFYFQ